MNYFWKTSRIFSLLSEKGQIRNCIFLLLLSILCICKEYFIFFLKTWDIEQNLCIASSQSYWLLPITLTIEIIYHLNVTIVEKHLWSMLLLQTRLKKLFIIGLDLKFPLYPSPLFLNFWLLSFIEGIGLVFEGKSNRCLAGKIQTRTRSSSGVNESRGFSFIGKKSYINQMRIWLMEFCTLLVIHFLKVPQMFLSIHETSTTGFL